MHHIPPTFAKLTLLLAFLFGAQVVAAQQILIAGSENGANASAAATMGQADVPGYFQPISSVDSIARAEAETNNMSWFLLLGGAGLGLIFFWLGRRSGAASTPIVPARRVAAATRTKPESPVPHEDKAARGGEAKYWVSLDQATTLTVDELSSVEEEAEVFLLLGRVDMAIGVLRHHVEADESAPAHVWMCLLDVLHTQGLRQEFEKLAAEIRERFNVALPTWEGANARSHELTGLEHFPHLFAKITSHWNSPDCLEYLHSLTQDNRNGERGGFHLDAFRELLMLIGVLECREKLAPLPVPV